MVISAKNGYMLIMLMMVVFVLSLGFLIAVPVWQTQVQREKEEELIFRGKQYMEAVRRYTRKNPGRFPSRFEELEDGNYIRRLYRDPMTQNGDWNVILQSDEGSAPGEGALRSILIAPESALDSLSNPRILGVASSSEKRSIRILHGQNTYDAWLFFFGYDPENPPRIIRYGEEKESP